MENYSAWSAEYMRQIGEISADTKLTAEPVAISGITAKTVEDKKLVNESTISGISVALCLDSQTAIRLYDSGKKIKDITAVHNNSNIAVNTGYSADKQKYYVEIPNITAHHLDDDYMITFGNQGTVTVSGFSYVYLALEYSEDETLKNVVKALYEYSRATEDFFIS